MPPSSQAPAGLARSASVLAVVACAGLLALVLWVAGRPLSTPDLWFHLKAGEAYFNQGLWPAHDPMLFTGLSTGPVQHEWLFGVFAHLGEGALGFHGLRLLHVAMVLGVVVLVAHLARKAAGSWTGAAAGVAAFLLLAWPRLVQFRPDLWTIAAVCAVYLLLLAPSAGPTRRALLLALGLHLLWSNAHSLAAIGVVLTASTLLGVAFERGILEQTERPPEAMRARAAARMRALALALPLLLVVGLIHPRGVDQLLTFFISTSDTAIWEIHDEWSPFHPLSLSANGGRVSRLGFLVADGIMLGFAALAVVRLRALRGRVTVEALERFDPPAFITAAAACGAMLISVRFLWMGLLPLLYLLTALRGLRAGRPAALLPASIASALALFAWNAGGLAAYASDVPRGAADYLGTPVNRGRFAHEAAQFLLDVEARGRLFNPYELGAYYGYHLAPGLRTFIDSRTEHYTAEVFAEWRSITFRGRHADGRDFLQLLDGRQVDFFLGVGPPGYGYSVPYTLASLDGQRGWVRVFRNAGQVLYLRDVPRNRDNLERIARHYARQGVPFDHHAGLDVGALLERNLPWALQQRVVPAGFRSVRERAAAGERPARVEALLQLADMRFVAGDYVGAARDAQRAMGLGARGVKPAEIAVASMQRLGDLQGAQRFLHTLSREHGDQPWAQRFLARFRR